MESNRNYHTCKLIRSKVDILLEKNGELDAQPFDGQEDED